MLRRLEAEGCEREAREKNLSLVEVEDNRIRKNRRRSRRSKGGEQEQQQYRVESSSGLLWTSKYQPRCGAEVVGCRAQVGLYLYLPISICVLQVSQLKDWLLGWVGGRRASEESGTGSEWGEGSGASGGEGAGGQ